MQSQLVSKITKCWLDKSNKNIFI